MRRPSWRDPRLLGGIALVLGSVALGAYVVSTADDTVAVYAAADTLVPGSPLSADLLDVARVRVPAADRLYVRAGTDLPEGAVAVRTVGAGELLPASAVGDPDRLDRKPLSVPLSGEVPRDLAPGVQVDVWVTPPDDGGPPAKLLTAVEVYGVTTGGGGLAGISAAAVELLLDDEGTAGLLAALSGGSRVDVVPIPGTSARP